MLLIPKIKCLSSTFPLNSRVIPNSLPCIFIWTLAGNSNKRTLGPHQNRLLSQHVLSQPTALNSGIALDSPSHPHIHPSDEPPGPSSCHFYCYYKAKQPISPCWPIQQLISWFPFRTKAARMILLKHKSDHAFLQTASQHLSITIPWGPVKSGPYLFFHSHFLQLLPLTTALQS